MYSLKPLGQILTLQRGFDITKAEQRKGAIPIVSSSGITSYHDSAQVRGPGVVIGRKGTLGTVHYLEGDFWPHDTTLWVKDFKGNTPRYCYYLLKYMKLEKYDVGSSNPTLNRNHVHLLDAPYAEPFQQKGIVEILSVYDELVENNTRRIAILDEIARRVFDEWFVQFRFPGNMERLSDGQLPEGWRRVPIKVVYDSLFDGPHATPSPSADGPVFLGIGNITEAGHLDLFSVRHISEQDFPKWTKRVTPQEGDIVFTYEATLNRYALIPPDFRGCLGRRLALIRVAPERRYNLFLYYYFFSSEWRQVIAANILSGATVDRIPLTTFPEFPINLPPDELVQRFDAVVRPMMRKIQVLSRQNEILRTARDLLLPKLISGEIDLGDAPLPEELAAE